MLGTGAGDWCWELVLGIGAGNWRLTPVDRLWTAGTSQLVVSVAVVAAAGTPARRVLALQLSPPAAELLVLRGARLARLCGPAPRDGRLGGTRLLLFQRQAHGRQRDPLPGASEPGTVTLVTLHRQRRRGVQLPTRDEGGGGQLQHSTEEPVPGTLSRSI